MQIVLDTRGLQMSVRNACFYIAGENHTGSIHPSRISSILITAPCRISSPALLLAAENQIPVVICNNSGNPLARLWSSRFLNTSGLRRKQYGFTASAKGLYWAEEIIMLKINSQLSNLKYLSSRLKVLKPVVAKAEEEINQQIEKQLKNSVDDGLRKKKILFCEAFAAARYWQIAGIQLPVPYQFFNRSKRAAGDPFNASINYLYGILRNETETAVLSLGLDPALGVMHRDGYKMPSLVFDIMEPFRPVADKLLFQAILGNKLPADGYTVSKEKCTLTKPGRIALINLFTNALYSNLIHRNRITTLKNHLLTEARILADQIKKS